MKALITFIKSLRRRKKNSIPVCPKCRNPKIVHANSISGWLTPGYYLCKECGYSGSLFLEVDKNP